MTRRFGTMERLDPAVMPTAGLCTADAARYMQPELFRDSTKLRFLFPSVGIYRFN